MFVFNFWGVFFVFLESLKGFLVVSLSLEVDMLGDAEVWKMVEKDKSAVIWIHHFEGNFGIINFQTPFPQFYKSIFEFLKIYSLVMWGVQILKHHVIFKILTQIKQKNSEFTPFNEVVAFLIFGGTEVFCSLKSTNHCFFRLKNRFELFPHRVESPIYFCQR